MSEQKSDEKRLAEIEARSGECSCGFNTCSAGGDVSDLIADLRAARAEIERLTDMLSKTGGAP